MTPDLAATLALKGLAFLMNSSPARERFIAATGIDPASLRGRADEPDFQTSVLDFLLANEDLVSGFCHSESVDVRAVHMARHVLAGG